MVAVIELICVDKIAPWRAEACDGAAAKRLVLGGVQRHRGNVVDTAA
jgi:hypothetical protein